jgi:hypothetical protein
MDEAGCRVPGHRLITGCMGLVLQSAVKLTSRACTAGMMHPAYIMPAQHHLPAPAQRMEGPAQPCPSIGAAATVAGNAAAMLTKSQTQAQPELALES